MLSYRTDSPKTFSYAAWGVCQDRECGHSEAGAPRRRHMTRLLVYAVALAFCLAAAPAALAGNDPRGDAKGNSALDIASSRHGRQAQLLVHRLTTYKRWRRALLANGGEISFYFDTDGDAALERRLDVRYMRGRLSAVMRDRRGRVVGRGLARRSSRYTVVVTFSRSLLPAGIRRYRWFAFAGFRCRHLYKECGDRAPNGGGLITHWLVSPPPPSIDPAPIAGQGYTLRFSEQFDGFSGGTWGVGIWYDPGSPAGSIYVQDGVLHLVSRRSQGYPNVTVTTEGGSIPLTFKQGYFEARMRWTKGPGAWPAFWLLSYAHATNPLWPSPACAIPNCLSAELDVFEGQGTEPNIYYGTIHRNSSEDYGVPNEQNANNYQDVGVDLTAGFHTYGMKWTATTISWYLDDALLMSAPVYDSTNQQMFLLLQMWTGGWTSGTDSTTPDELHTEVDWVRAWAEVG
jgi:Glycosyl hydrolases family 16